MTIVQNPMQHTMFQNRGPEDVRCDQKEAVLKAGTVGVGHQSGHAISGIQEIREGIPFYGTQRVAAEMYRRLGKGVNRKAVRRICKTMGQNKPGPTQKGLLDTYQGRPAQRGTGDRYCVCLARSCGWMVYYTQPRVA